MRESMKIYPITAAGRAMKLKEVLLRADPRRSSGFEERMSLLTNVLVL
jgi:hypothetical protein